MTVHSTESTMVSDVTPEVARRDPDTGTWSLSWLPDRRLTEHQARTGMEIDELLSDPERVDDPGAHTAIDAGAAILGLPAEQVVILLSTRILARMAEDFDRAETPRDHPPATGRGRGGPRVRGHVIEPPRVFG